MNPAITITAAASAYIQKMLEKEQGIGFRLSVKKTGCSGYSYVPAIIKQPNANDLTINMENGWQLFVDTNWLDLLTGLQIDYVEDEKSGLKQKRLVFTNPNEASRCGCGESFHIEG